MAWQVLDPRSAQELMLVLPRMAGRDANSTEQWMQAARRAGRLNHPHLAQAVEIGAHEGWPFVTYDTAGWTTLDDRIGDSAMPAVEAALVCSKVLDGLAYAPEAGVVHHDVQPFLILINDQGAVRVTGLEVASHHADDGTPVRQSSDATSQVASQVASGDLRAQRDVAERDVLAMGVVLHHALMGKPALDEADVGRVIDRMPPTGNEVVRLPFDTPQPLPEALRAIANRATDRQARQRYRSARTLSRALEGWALGDDSQGAGPLALLLDRVSTLGALPAAKGGGRHAARLARMERQRTNELAAEVIDDIGLVFDLLRQANSAQLRGAQAAGSGPVLTARRAIAMIGLDGARRVANALRPWPGALAESAAPELDRVMRRVKLAGRVAMGIRPAGYDAEVVYLITLLQNLGALIVQYHCADEAQQIQRLMQSSPPERAGDAPRAGMSEEAAACSVLGVGVDAVGAAVARRWGLDESVVPAMRRLEAGAPVHAASNDDDLLRATASCANEAVEALALPSSRQSAAINKVAQRYARALGFSAKDLHTAMHDAATRSTADMLRAANGNAMFVSEGGSGTSDAAGVDGAGRPQFETGNAASTGRDAAGSLR